MSLDLHRAHITLTQEFRHRYNSQILRRTLGQEKEIKDYAQELGYIYK